MLDYQRVLCAFMVKTVDTIFTAAVATNRRRMHAGPHQSGETWQSYCTETAIFSYAKNKTSVKRLFFTQVHSEDQFAALMCGGNIIVNHSSMDFIIFQANWEIVFAYPFWKFKDEDLHTSMFHSLNLPGIVSRSLSSFSDALSPSFSVFPVGESIHRCWTSIWNMIFLGGSCLVAHHTNRKWVITPVIEVD